MAASKYLTRQDLAELLETSVDVVANNEVRWGLEPLKYNGRFIRFDRAHTMAALEARGLLLPPNSD